MTNFSDLGRLGSVDLKKTGGTAGAFTGQISLPAAFIQPYNNTNTSYLDAINSNQSTALAVAGNKTPQVAIRTYFKPSVFNAALFNSLIGLVDATTGYTDQFAIRVKSQYGTRIWSKARCTGITLTHTKQGAQPGPTLVDLGFASIYGENEDPSLPTFTAGAVVAGQATNAGQVYWGNSVDQVKSWTLQMMRVQEYQFSDNHTLYADEIATGAADGGLAIVQSSTYTATPGSSAIINLGGTGAGIAITALLDLFSPFTPQDSGFVRYNAGFKLCDLSAGATPYSFAAL